MKVCYSLAVNKTQHQNLQGGDLMKKTADQTNNTTELVFILDQSGSMSPLRDDTIGGFNTMLEQQKKTGANVLVSTVMFSETSAVVHDRVRIEDVRQLTRDDYAPMGCTALLDAVGSAVKHISNIHKYARSEDIPHKTMFVITTDGMENASTHYCAKEVKRLIEKQKKKYNWEFLFIGANIDSVQTAEDMGIDARRAVNYTASANGTRSLFKGVGKAVTEACMCDREEISDYWKADIE